MKRLFLYAMITSILLGCSSKSTNWDATGTFEATEVIVSAEANGRILSFELEEGDRIQAGSLLGVIDTMQLSLRKKQLQSGMQAADIRKPDIAKQIASLRQQITTAESERDRAQKLVDARAGNQKQVDDWDNQIKYLRKQVVAQYSSLAKTANSTDAEVQGLQYQVMQIDDQLQKSWINNPRTGTVLTKYAEAGELAVTGKALYKVADIDLMYLRAYITADQLADLEIGQAVEVYTDQGKSFDGTLSWVSEQAEFTPKGILTKDERASQSYAIKIAVKNDGTIKIGQYGEVKF